MLLSNTNPFEVPWLSRLCPHAAITAVEIAPVRCVSDRRHQSRHVAGFERVGLVDSRARELGAPWSSRPGAAHRPGVERAEIDVGAVFVGLAATKPRRFDAASRSEHAKRQHAGRDVDRVEMMMRERRLRIFRGRRPMHERRRSERRRAHCRRRRRQASTGRPSCSMRHSASKTNREDADSRSAARCYRKFRRSEIPVASRCLQRERLERKHRVHASTVRLRAAARPCP